MTANDLLLSVSPNGEVFPPKLANVNQTRFVYRIHVLRQGREVLWGMLSNLGSIVESGGDKWKVEVTGLVKRKI